MGFRRNTDNSTKKALSGQWKLIDDHTGFVIYSDDAAINWDGQISHKNDLDELPGDLFPAKVIPKEDSTVPFNSPEPPDLEPSTWITAEDL